MFVFSETNVNYFYFVCFLEMFLQNSTKEPNVDGLQNISTVHFIQRYTTFQVVSKKVVICGEVHYFNTPYWPTL